jgi:hypothetical protein
VGEEGCGPGVEREVVEGFSRGLVTSDSTEGHVRSRTDSVSAGGVSTSHEMDNRGDVQGRESVVMTLDGHENIVINIGLTTDTDTHMDVDTGVNDRLETESGEESDNFALFRASESQATNKVLYLPVPVKYQPRDSTDPSFTEGKTHREKNNKYSGRNNGDDDNDYDDEYYTYNSKKINTKSKNKNNDENIHEIDNNNTESNGHKPYDVKVSRLLRKGFKAFGQLVGHFILRKIASTSDELRDVISNSCRDF